MIACYNKYELIKNCSSPGHRCLHPEAQTDCRTKACGRCPEAVLDFSHERKRSGTCRSGHREGWEGLQSQRQPDWLATLELREEEAAKSETVSAQKFEFDCRRDVQNTDQQIVRFNGLSYEDLGQNFGCKCLLG